ncbi:MAG: zinc metallopeptidase [Candidatus Omnitrophica bacterium]|nr:zinc metallopeptidase [Candidatus Omnitrophota bacterium]
MVWCLILGCSFLAFATEVWLIRENGRFQNRRRVTGAEIARYILDAGGFKQTIVDFPREGSQESQSGIEQLYLEKSVYEGGRLLDIAHAARTAVLKTGIPEVNFFPSISLKRRLWKVHCFLILLSWLMVILGSLSSYLSGIRLAGFLIFLVTFIVAMIDLPAEWNISHQAMVHLRNSRHFEIDEIIRLKNLMNALRLDGLAQLFKVPLSFLKIGQHPCIKI